MKTGIIHRDFYINRMTATHDEGLENTSHLLLPDKPMIENNVKILLEKKVSDTLQRSTSDSKNDSVTGITIDINRSDTEKAPFQRNSTGQSKEGTEPQREDSLEYMKERISSYLSYLESDTDSSDTELSESNGCKKHACQKREIIQGIIQSNPHYQTDYESTGKRRRPCPTTKEDVKNFQNEENLYIEKKFKLFTTKWDVKTRHSLRKHPLTPSTPACKLFNYKCDVSLLKQCAQLPSDKPQLYEVTNKPKKNEENKISINDTTENVKTHANRRNVASMCDCTALQLESIREESNDGECFGRSVVEEEKYKRCSGQNQWSPGGSEENLENKATEGRNVEKNSSSVTCVKISSNNLMKCLESERDEQKCTNQSVKSTKSERLDSGNYLFKSTMHQSIDGHANDESTSSEKNTSRSPPKISKNTAIRKRFSNECEYVSREQKSGEVKEKLIANSCQLAVNDESERKEAKIQLQPEKISRDKRKRSRSNSSGRSRERRRSRSGSVDRRPKDSPIRDRRNYQTTRRMQYSRTDRRINNRYSNDSSFGSWIDNIVVKIADPPRPPRKKQLNMPKVRDNIPRQPTRRPRTKPSPYEERTTQSDESGRIGTKRRWTYDDYVRRSDGGLRRKSSYDCDDEENVYLKRYDDVSYDDDNTMPYKGYADSQVQSLLKQLCGHYVTKLYSTHNDVCQSSYIAVSNGDKPHRTWYMTSSSDWILYGEDTSKDTTSFNIEGSIQDPATETNCLSASNQDQQKHDQSTTAQEKQEQTATNDCEIFYEEICLEQATREEDLQFIAVQEEIRNDKAKQDTTMDVQDIRQVSTSENKHEDKDCATALKGKENETEDQNYRNENVKDSLNEKSLNLSVGKFLPFTLKSKTLCDKTQANEVFKQSDLSDDDQKNTDNNADHCNVEIVTISEISNSTCDSCQNESDDFTNDLDHDPNREEHDETSFPGPVKLAFEKFAKDTFAVSNLCKNRVTNLGQEVTRNELLVMVTPSSYLYEKKISGDAKPVEDVSCKQSLCVPTSTCLSRPTNVASTSVCFHFDIDNFETLPSVEDFSHMKQKEHILCGHDFSDPQTLLNDFSRCNNTRNSNSERHSVASETETKNLDNEKLLASSLNTEINSLFSSTTRMHSDNSVTLTPMENVTEVSETLELPKALSTTRVNVSAENQTFEQRFNGISSKRVTSHSQEIVSTSSTSATFQNDGQHLPSPRFPKASMSQERLMIQSKTVELYTGEDMWDLALMTTPSSTSSSSTHTKTYSKGCDLDIAIVKPSRRTNALTATNGENVAVLHAERDQSNHEMQEISNNYMSNRIQKNLQANPQNYENSVGYPSTVVYHQHNLPTVGSIVEASSDLLLTAFKQTNIQQPPVVIDCSGQRSVPGAVPTYLPHKYPVVSYGSRITSQLQQPEFIEQPLAVNYVNNHSVANNNTFIVNNQDGPLNHHPTFNYDEQPYAHQQLIPQLQLPSQHCNTTKGSLPMQRASSIPFVAMETAITDSYNAATVGYNVGTAGRQDVYARKQNIANLSVVPVATGKYCEPQMMPTPKRAYHQLNKTNTDKQEQHKQQARQLQQDKQQLQQQQQHHFKPPVRDKRLSEDQHTTFLNSVHHSPSDVSHIPWGQHIRDHSHQASIPHLSHDIFHYKWY